MKSRGLTLERAAKYCGISKGAYRQWMKKEIVPGFWGSTRRIDRLALDAALDKLSGRDKLITKSSKFEAWKAGTAPT